MRTFLARTTHAVDRRSRLFGPASLALWFVAITSLSLAAWRDGSTVTYVTLGVLLALFLVTHLQAGALKRAHDRGLRASISFLYTTRYMTEIRGFADSTTFLADLKHSRDVTRRSGTPSVVVGVWLSNLEEIRDRHGDHLGSNAVTEFSKTLRRITRGDDLAAYLGSGRFAVLLLDCSFDESSQFVRRVPAFVTAIAGGEPVQVVVGTERYNSETTDPDDLMAAIAAGPSRPAPRRVERSEPFAALEAA
ncbi:MAG: diguanylate cyclase [Chloroflexi bacterium]|nr:diguanylate cyclase [Chloroflexota bacterium]